MSRPIGSYGDWSISFRDGGNEIGTMSGVARVVYGDDDDSNIATQQDLFLDFVSAVDLIALGAIKKTEYVLTVDFDPALPINGAAREFKLLVMYKCLATGKRYSLTLPTMSPGIIAYIDNVSVKDAIDMTTPVGIVDFITAFEAFVVAPDIPAIAGAYATNPAISVIGLRAVGRNN